VVVMWVSLITGLVYFHLFYMHGLHGPYTTNLVQMHVRAAIWWFWAVQHVQARKMDSQSSRQHALGCNTGKRKETIEKRQRRPEVEQEFRRCMKTIGRVGDASHGSTSNIYSDGGQVHKQSHQGVSMFAVTFLELTSAC